MFCPKCGRDDSPRLKFCPTCGTNLDVVTIALSTGEDSIFTRVKSISTACEEEEWRVLQTRGITPEQVQLLIASDPEVRT